MGTWVRSENESLRCGSHLGLEDLGWRPRAGTRVRSECEKRDQSRLRIVQMDRLRHTSLFRTEVHVKSVHTRQ